jgi:hypothetical protein
MTLAIRKPDHWQVEKARDALYLDKLMELMGEALNEADDTKQRRIAMAVMSQDPLEVGQIVMDVLEAYCKVDDDEAYDQAQAWIEFGDEA